MYVYIYHKLLFSELCLCHIVLCYICYILHCFTFQNKQGMENEKIDYLAVRLQTFETENERLKGDVVRLKNDNDRLRMVS